MLGDRQSWCDLRTVSQRRRMSLERGIYRKEMGRVIGRYRSSELRRGAIVLVVALLMVTQFAGRPKEVGSTWLDGGDDPVRPRNVPTRFRF